MGSDVDNFQVAEVPKYGYVCSIQLKTVYNNHKIFLFLVYNDDVFPEIFLIIKLWHTLLGNRKPKYYFQINEVEIIICCLFTVMLNFCKLPYVSALSGVITFFLLKIFCQIRITFNVINLLKFNFKLSYPNA